jgi:hypothetical protein
VCVGLWNGVELCVVALSRNLKLTTTLDRAITQNPCKEPIYTKLGGMYGYLSVSMFNVHFFWYDGSNVCFDDVTDKFRVEYVFLNGN